jgi:redox-sensitive bicupin YhaK (pirin superfamily)
VSNLEAAPEEDVCAGRVGLAEEPVRQLLTGRDVVLGGLRGMAVTRTLPNKGKRMVGAWCFLDHYGPERTAMRVPPHPHTGLQTVSWLVQGEIRHRDSLGNDQLVSPGQLNLMTAGRAIAHAEESTVDGVLHGVQLWVALPGPQRHTAPAFAHHPDLPVVSTAGLRATVLMGELAGEESPARCFTPLVGAEVALDRADSRLPLRPDYEYAVLALTGASEVDGVVLEPGPLLYLGAGRSELSLSGESTRLLLLGGEPFEEQLVMWWNFVARDHDEIVAQRAEWMAGLAGSETPFGQVNGYDGDPLAAPPMPTTRLLPRSR